MHLRLVWFVVAAAVCLLSIFLSVEIPRVARATGYTDGQKQLSKVFAAGGGVLIALGVSNHVSVRRGQVLGELTLERFRQNTSLEAAQANLTEQKISLIKSELTRAETTESANQQSTKSRIESAQREMEAVKQEIVFATQRLDGLALQLDRQKELLTQGFVSAEAVEIRRSDWLAQKLQVSALQRTQLQLMREIATQQEELRLVTLRAQTQRAQLMREMATNEQEYNEHSAKRIQLIAPTDGLVTQISASVGQTVRPEIPILTIVPENAEPEVLLLVPSRSIGFIREGQKVSVRYQAYPHAHYGRHYGKVKEIARAALAPQEVVQHIRVDEPVYTVKVALPANYMEYQGKKLPLSPGMVVEADIELDRLKIYQWLLEPLYRLGSRV